MSDQQAFQKGRKIFVKAVMIQLLKQALDKAELDLRDTLFDKGLESFINLFGGKQYLYNWRSEAVTDNLTEKIQFHIEEEQIIHRHEDKQEVVKPLIDHLEQVAEEIFQSYVADAEEE